MTFFSHQQLGKCYFILSNYIEHVQPKAFLLAQAITVLKNNHSLSATHTTSDFCFLPYIYFKKIFYCQFPFVPYPNQCVWGRIDNCSPAYNLKSVHHNENNLMGCQPRLSLTTVDVYLDNMGVVIMYLENIWARMAMKSHVTAKCIIWKYMRIFLVVITRVEWVYNCLVISNCLMKFTLDHDWHWEFKNPFSGYFSYLFCFPCFRLEVLMQVMDPPSCPAW